MWQYLFSAIPLTELTVSKHYRMEFPNWGQHAAIRDRNAAMACAPASRLHPKYLQKEFDNDGHKPRGLQTMTMTATTMTVANHDDQLGEIYPTMLNEVNCTFGTSFSRLHCCGHHGHGLWPRFVAVMVVAVLFVAIMV